MISKLLFLIFCGIIIEHLGNAQKMPKIKKLNMNVHINITGDTLIMKFHRPGQNIKLEGFILGYGSNYFTNQYIQWPDNGKSYITDVEAETRYLIAVKPNDNPKKSCKEKNSSHKPLQVVIGSLTPTSVYLSWGILVNPQVDWSALNKCVNDRFYTVRYREKNKDWLFQLCPTTETVIDNLKPNTMYEFSVKDNSDDEMWGKSQNHKTNYKGKENGNIENTYKIPKGTLQSAPEDTKALVPVNVIKPGFLNITKFTASPTEHSPDIRKETKKPHLRTTTRTMKPKPVSKVTDFPPIIKPTEKPIDELPNPDHKTSHPPPDVLGFDIFEHPELRLVQNNTEKAISSKSGKSTPPATAVPKAMQTKMMPINLIRLHIFEDPTAPSEKTVKKTTLPPSNKITHSKPAPKTQSVPINFIHLHIYQEPDVTIVPNTTIPPYQSTATQRPESHHSKPVPAQKISQQTNKKPKATPHAKPASTEAPKDTIKPKIPHVPLATLAPYRLQHTSSKPKTSVRPRTRFAQNGTTQGLIKPKTDGEINWVAGTIPGPSISDSTKLLGGRTNISMTPNNTAKRTFLVSSTPILPARPTPTRRKVQHGNITGRSGATVSSPPLTPVRPTPTRRRHQPTNVTGRPGSAVETTVFSPSPKSDVDALGKNRYVAPHVVYMARNESLPCSITESLRYFPTEEGSNQEIVSPPQNPPSNLTVVTVEGCSSFVILDWDQPDNDTVTEYEVISKENGAPPGKDQSIITTNQTYSTVENLKPDTSYEFHVIPKNPLGEGPVSTTVEFNTESADPRVSEPVSAGKDAIWTEIKFKSDSYSECKGKQFVKRTWYKKFVGIQLCNSLRYKIYLSDTLSGKFYNIGDQTGFGEDHCQFVDSFLDGRTGQQLLPEYLEPRKGFYRSVRQQPVDFGEIGGRTHISYVHWYECGIAIPGKW